MPSFKDMGPMSLNQLHDPLKPEGPPRDTEAQAEPGAMRNRSETLAINAALDAENILRGNLQYIRTKEGVELPFRGILQPHGVPEEHVQAMLEDKESYPGLRLYQADPTTRRVAGYSKPSMPSPEIVQKGDFFYFSPIAVHMYAEFMRKYTNNPNIRVFKDNAESLKFLEVLEGGTNGEKFQKAGIPMPGAFDADNARVVREGALAYWVTLSAYEGVFATRGIRRDYHYSSDDWIPFDGSVPLLIEDIVSE